MNSVYVLAAFVGFIALGYVSLVRLLYKYEQYSQKTPTIGLRGLLSSQHLFTTLASSTLFLALPAASFLLFWGWGPALLWLVVAHLLVETPGNFIAVKMLRQVDVASHFADYDSVSGSLRALVMHLVLICLCALMLAVLANLIDQQTGLLFALAGVFLSIHLLKSASGAVDAIIKLSASVGILSLGLVLAQTMGIAVFGNWAPFEAGLKWLQFDSRTVLALILLLGAIQLNQSSSLRSGALNLIGALIAAFSVLIMIQLLWQQPLLDAPTLASTLTASADDSMLPSFVSLFIFLSGSMLILLMRLVGYGSTFDHNDDKTEAQEFKTLQLAGLLALILSIAVVLWLASASGIGAWNTHYTNWPEAVTIQAHLGLVSRALGAAISSEPGFLATGLVIGLCLFALACLLYLINTLNQQTIAAEDAGVEEQTLFTLLLSKFNLQICATYVLAAWFLSYGMSVDLWLWVMAVCWLLSCDVLLEYASELESPEFGDHFRRAFALALFGLGGLQLLWTTTYSMLYGSTLSAIAYTAIILLAVVLCLRNAVKTARGLKLRGETKLFTG